VKAACHRANRCTALLRVTAWSEQQANPKKSATQDEVTCTRLRAEGADAGQKEIRSPPSIAVTTNKSAPLSLFAVSKHITALHHQETQLTATDFLLTALVTSCRTYRGCWVEYLGCPRTDPFDHTRKCVDVNCHSKTPRGLSHSSWSTAPGIKRRATPEGVSVAGSVMGEGTHGCELGLSPRQ